LIGKKGTEKEVREKNRGTKKEEYWGGYA